MKTCYLCGSADIVIDRKGQIKKRGYHKKFPADRTKLIGIAIDLEGRKVGHYIIISE